jgi:D-amino-acid dehydrogenase
MPCNRCWPADLITRQGVLFAYPDRAAFEAEAMSWRIRHDNGTRWLELDDDQLRQSEPTLSRDYKFAVLVQENGQCRDPGAYVAALVRLATASGATLLRTRATGFHIALHRLRAVLTVPSSRRVRIRNNSPQWPGIACRWKPNAATTW